MNPAMYTALLLGLLHVPATPVPRVNVSCVARNTSYTVSHYNKEANKLDVTEIEDWHVTCKITSDDKEIFNDELKLVHPINFHDTMEEINDFRTKRAPEIAKGKKK